MRARGHETPNEQTANGKLYGRTGVRLLARFPPSKSFQREPSALGAADRVPGDPFRPARTGRGSRDGESGSSGPISRLLGELAFWLRRFGGGRGRLGRVLVNGERPLVVVEDPGQGYLMRIVGLERRESVGEREGRLTGRHVGFFRPCGRVCQVCVNESGTV